MEPMTLTSSLTQAATNFGQCAKLIENKAAPNPLPPVGYEQLIAFGMARDWVGWAKDFGSIAFTNRRRSKSDRAHALNELTRFTYMWTAANAVFARTEVLRLADPTIASGASELERFRVLFKRSGLSPSDIAAKENTLHSLLRLPMNVKHFPWVATNSPPTILEVIYFKYTVQAEQTRGTGKKILNATVTGNYAALDLPTLIYATRNWNIHGVLLSSSFRGTQKKFDLWIDTINLALAQVLEGSSKTLQLAIRTAVRGG
jgi:hypothetical protein